MKTIEKAAVKSRAKAKHADSTTTNSVQPGLVEGLVPLSTVVTLNPRKFTLPIADDDVVSFVPMKCVEEETGNLDATTLRPWHEVKKGYTAFQDNDVIFAKITPCMENGKFAVARGLKGGRAAGSTEFHVLRPTERLSSHYLMHFLFQHHIRQDARMNMRGAAGQLRVPTDFFESLKIPLPPLPTQHRIVAEIEEKLSRLDAAQSALLRAQTNLKRYRESVLEASFDIVRDQNLHKAGDLFSYVTSGSRGWAKYYASSGAAFIRVGNVRRNQIALDLEDLQCVQLPSGAEGKRTRLEIDDILITVTADVGRIGVVEEGIGEAYVNQHVALARPNNLCTPRFLAWFLTSKTGNRQLTMQQRGATRTGLGLGDISNVLVPVPSLKNQLEIVTEIERRLSVIDRTEQTLRTQLERSKRLRQSILQQAFSPTRRDA